MMLTFIGALVHGSVNALLEDYVYYEEMEEGECYTCQFCFGDLLDKHCCYGRDNLRIEAMIEDGLKTVANFSCPGCEFRGRFVRTSLAGARIRDGKISFNGETFSLSKISDGSIYSDDEVLVFEGCSGKWCLGCETSRVAELDAAIPICHPYDGVVAGQPCEICGNSDSYRPVVMGSHHRKVCSGCFNSDDVFQYLHELMGGISFGGDSSGEEDYSPGDDESDEGS